MMKVMPVPPPPNRAFVVSSSGTRMIAPISGPNRVPAPPSAATISILTEIRIPSALSGSMKPTITAYSDPASAVKAADSISAYSLYRSTGTPRLLAARSPPRMAAR